MFRTRRATVPLAAALACFAFSVHADEVFTAAMDGAQILPEPVKTEATGTVELRVSPDGKKIAYKITVNKLLNATSAELHMGPATQNGPVIATIFSAPKKGEFSGVLAEGTITGADLVGPLTGAPLSELLEELRASDVYVNVHTNDGVDPPDSGPGDYRFGEIRGHFK
jgi:CHRD domain